MFSMSADYGLAIENSMGHAMNYYYRSIADTLTEHPLGQSAGTKCGSLPSSRAIG